MARDDIDLGFATRLDPHAAIEYFARKGYAVSWNWWEVWETAHARAFTVAKATQANVLESIREALDRALRKGQTRREFAREIEPRLRALGWWGRKVVVSPDGGAEVVQLGSPWRLKTIYDSNMRSTYGAARIRQQLSNAGSRPFWMYDARNDDRTRPSHAAMDGMVFRFDDAIWESHYPPNGWNCRCRVRPLTAEQVRRRGLRVRDSAGALDTVQQRVGVDKRTGEIVERPGTAYRFRGRDGEMHTMTPDAGWGTAPQGLPGPPAVPPGRPGTAPPPIVVRPPAAPDSRPSPTEAAEVRLLAAHNRYLDELSPEAFQNLQRTAEAYRDEWDALPPPVLGADSDAARDARRRARDIVDDHAGVRRRPDGIVEPLARTDDEVTAARTRAEVAMEHLTRKSRPPDTDWSRRVALRYEEAHRPGVEDASRMIDPVLLRRGRVGVEPYTSGPGSFVRRKRFEPASTMHLRQDAPPWIVVHELGHTVEVANDELLREAAAFLDRQTTGPALEAPPDAGGYDYRPGFKRRYTGRVYRPQGPRYATLADGSEVEATEVVSIGLEEMRENPMRFALEQPDFFDFILTRVLFRRTPPGVAE